MSGGRVADGSKSLSGRPLTAVFFLDHQGGLRPDP